MKKTFSIVVPVYQNEYNLNDTLTKLLSLKDKLPDYRLELVLVDDGSTDGSFSILHDYSLRYPKDIRIIKLTKNFGQIPAIQAGLHHATGDCAGIISADLQDPYELFIDMIRHWENGYSLVIGERAEREDGFVQNIVSGVYWKLIHKFVLKDFPKGGFDFCLIDRVIIEEINRINEKNTMIFVLIFSLGYTYKILPFKRRKRTAGKSQWTLSKKVKLFLDTFINFSYLPLRLISVSGLIIAMMSLVMIAYFVLIKIFFDNPVTGWTSLVVLISLFGGMTLFTLGIIGEYIWRILEETRKRPLFVIEKIITHKTQPVQN